jgi:hypothetical protein
MDDKEAEKILLDVLYKARWVDGIKDGKLLADAELARAIREAGFVHIEEEIV